jgi:hypothetical protein
MDPRHQFDLQTDLPVFVRAVPPGMKYLKFSGRTYQVGDHIPWQEFGMEYDTVKMLMAQRLLHHSEERSVEKDVGDGLDKLNIEELETLVKAINEKVANIFKNNKQAFQRYRCRQSRIRDKQIGLIRSWRRNHGKFESMQIT